MVRVLKQDTHHALRVKIPRHGKRTRIVYNQPMKKTHPTIGDWVKVGNYHICVHEVTQMLVPSKPGHNSPPSIILSSGYVIDAAPDSFDRVVYFNVEYRNNSDEPSLSCRRSQWVLYDVDGYSYDPEMSERIYTAHNFRYFGGDRMVNPGMNARGWLGVIVPFDAPIQRIQFLTGFLATKSADIYLGSDFWHSPEAIKRLPSG